MVIRDDFITSEIALIQDRINNIEDLDADRWHTVASLVDDVELLKSVIIKQNNYIKTLHNIIINKAEKGDIKAVIENFQRLKLK